MTIREKIILGSALLAAFVGALSLVAPGAGGSVESAETARAKARADIEATAQAVRSALQSEKLEPVEAKVLALLKERHDKDPFIRAENLARLPDQPASGSQMVFEYSGFLAMGGKAFAIINGTEYQVGDEILDSGYVLKRAAPEAAVIARKGDRREIVLTFKE